MAQRVTWLVAFFSLFVATACGPDSRLVLGTISDQEEPVVPDSARAGQPFTATVYTQGDACHSLGPTRVDVQGNVAVVTPYDMFSGADACATVQITFAHEADLRFEEPGEASVLFHVSEGRSGEVLEISRIVRIY